MGLKSGGGDASMRRSVLTLGAVSALDMVSQFVLPIILARQLSTQAFGDYRALWLIVGTAIATLPLQVPQSLFYFLPRTEGRARSEYMVQAMVFMLVAGVLSIGLVLLPASGVNFDGPQLISVSAFVSMWVFSSLLDFVCSALQRSSLQASINLFFSVFRFVLIAGVAWVTHSISSVIYAHVILGVIKACTCILVVFLLTKETGASVFNMPRWKEQIQYALPFGIFAALYGMRSKADQWIVVSLFSSAVYSVYSIASFFSPVQGLIRTTVSSVLLPEINRLHADQNHQEMVRVNRRGNLAVALVMFPTLAYIFATVDVLLGVLFSEHYVAAAAAARIYVFVLFVECIEITTLLMAYKQGRFFVLQNAWLIVFTVAVGGLGAWWMGMTGAAIGGAGAAVLAQWSSYRRLTQVADIPMGQAQSWSDLSRVLLAAVLGSLAAWAVIAMLPHTPALIVLLLAALALSLVYYLGLHMMRLGESIRQVLGVKIASLLFFK